MKVPRTFATPKTSRITESVLAPKARSSSRKGRRYVKKIWYPPKLRMFPPIPARIHVRRSRRTCPGNRCPRGPGERGRARYCQTNPKAAMSAPRKKTFRQPIRWPIQLATGQGDDRRYGNPGVDDAQGAGDVLRGDELQGDGGGQRPEAAHADAEYRTPDEHDRIGRSHADQHVGRDKHGGKSQQDAPPVGVSRQRGQQEAGQHGEHAYGGDRLPGHALGDGKISGNGRQQAYGDEFGCNQGHDAHK